MVVRDQYPVFNQRDFKEYTMGVQVSVYVDFTVWSTVKANGFDRIYSPKSKRATPCLFVTRRRVSAVRTN